MKSQYIRICVAVMILLVPIFVIHPQKAYAGRHLPDSMLTPRQIELLNMAREIERRNLPELARIQALRPIREEANRILVALREAREAEILAQRTVIDLINQVRASQRPRSQAGRALEARITAARLARIAAPELQRQAALAARQVADEQFRNAFNALNAQEMARRNQGILAIIRTYITQTAQHAQMIAAQSAQLARQTRTQIITAGTAAAIWARSAGISILTAAQSAVATAAVQLAAAVAVGVAVGCEGLFIQYARAITTLQTQCDAYISCQDAIARNVPGRICGGLTLSQISDQINITQTKAQIMASYFNRCTSPFRAHIAEIDINVIQCN